MMRGGGVARTALASIVAVGLTAACGAFATAVDDPPNSNPSADAALEAIATPAVDAAADGDGGDRDGSLEASTGPCPVGQTVLFNDTFDSAAKLATDWTMTFFVAGPPTQGAAEIDTVGGATPPMLKLTRNSSYGPLLARTAPATANKLTAVTLSFDVNLAPSTDMVFAQLSTSSSLLALVRLHATSTQITMQSQGPEGGGAPDIAGPISRPTGPFHVDFTVSFDPNHQASANIGGVPIAGAGHQLVNTGSIGTLLVTLIGDPSAASPIANEFDNATACATYTQ